MAKTDPYDLSYLETFGASVTRMGEIPQHIAFIMDGNRRYARKNGMKIIQGHNNGAGLVRRVNRWTKAVGCKEITLFAFSTENFKRSPQEVCDLMQLLTSFVGEILQDIDSGVNTDTRYEMIGDWSLIPDKVRHRMATMMVKSKHLTPYKCNIAVAYTGREGMLRSLNSIPVINGKLPGKLNPSQWNEYLASQAQHVSNMRPVDLLIRTGGDQRVSDFMMWESANACIHFTPTTWPEFGFWGFIHAIFMYQLHRKNIPVQATSVVDEKEMEEIENILQESRDQRWKQIQNWAKKDFPYDKIDAPVYAVDNFKQGLTNMLKF